MEEKGSSNSSSKTKRNSLSSSEMDANELVSSGEDVLSSKDSLNSIASIKVEWFYWVEPRRWSVPKVAIVSNCRVSACVLASWSRKCRMLRSWSPSGSFSKTGWNSSIHHPEDLSISTSWAGTKAGSLLGVRVHPVPPSVRMK